MTSDQYKENVLKLNYWGNMYYTYDTPVATDEEYDKLYKEIVIYESNNKNDILPYSPTFRVGNDILDKFSKAKHINRLWSLEDIFNNDELVNWYNRIYNIYPNVTFFIQPKYDGLSLNIIYKDGVLTQAITRGDGEIGEDVTNNVRTIKNIPLTIPYKDTIEIRGEVVIKKLQFININKERELNKEPLFANPRNASAGSLRQLDSSITAKRNLYFQVWDIKIDKDINFNKSMELVKELGFNPGLGYEVKSLEEIDSIYKKFIESRDDIDIELDGMVIKVNDYEIQNELGYTFKFPKWACAYKFPASEKVTKLLDVINQVGKSGIITPVGIIEPIELNGAIVERVTLHNYDNIKTKDIKLNDEVVIIRSGDVIPKLIKVFTDRRSGEEISIMTPTTCPCCHKPLIQENVYLRCINNDCIDKNVALLSAIASKDQLNIVGLSEGVIRLLLENKKVSNIIDLLKLTKEQLSGLEGFGEKKINNLLQSIQDIKNLPLDRFINALNIETIGRRASKTIASQLLEPSMLLNTEDKVWENITGLGEVSKNNLLSFLNTNKDYIKELNDILEPKIISKVTDGKYQNKLFVITGTVSKPRKEIEKYIELNGGRIGSSVTKSTDYLISNDTTSTKYKDAIKFNIKILKENEI